MKLDTDVRDAVRTLKRRGLGIRAVARALRISRNAVRRNLHDEDEPALAGPRAPAIISEHPRLEIIVRLLFKQCDGMAQRMVECLQTDHTISMGYSTLTRYVRTLGLRQPRRGSRVSGEIITGPGVEGQLDTSPIFFRFLLKRELVKLYLANVILGFSRHRYAEFFARWTRFHAQVFLVRALRWFKGLPRYMGIDNGREIIILGSGKNAIVAAEMERFADRLGFKFVAIELEHKDRQGKVEKAHQFVQSNFLKNRRASNLADLNAQLAQWCRDLLPRRVRKQTFAPADRWEEELAHLQPIPVHIPEPAMVWKRKGDDKARVWLHGSSYRVPDRFVLKELTVRETGDELIVIDGRDEVCRHPRTPECERKHSPLKGSPDQKTKRAPRSRPSAEELDLRSMGPEVCRYLDALECRPIRYSYARLRRFYRLAKNYPNEIFVATMAEALVKRAFDLNVVENALEAKMGHRIKNHCFASDPELEARPAYRKGQVTPHRLKPEPSAESSGSDNVRENRQAPPAGGEGEEDKSS